eukprot:g5306.t1
MNINGRSVVVIKALMMMVLCTMSRARETDNETTSKYPFVGKWRGYHGHGVGLCTAELISPLWVITAGHCAVRILRNEKVRVQVDFEDVERGVTRCIHAPKKVDVALCKLKLPINSVKIVSLNRDLYTSAKIRHAKKTVLCVGTYHGTHVTGPKKLEYESSGAHLYVDNSKGSGMHAGDSGGAWLMGGNASSVLTGIIHGGEGSGTHRRGVAAQVSYLKQWIDSTTNGTASWVSVS